MNLTPLQLQTYDSFGFLVIPRFLSPDQVQALRDEVTRMKTAESGEGDPLKHSGRVIGMFHKSELLLSLFDDSRLDAVARQLLKQPADLRFLGDEYVSYSTPADWHPDMGPTEPFEALKFGFYLDDLSRGGCLRVVPGSHHPQFSKAVDAYRGATGGDPKPEVPWAHSCVVQPGDLLIFNLKLWHQGTANPPGTHRRVIFWSVGEGSGENFKAYARRFHNSVGRGEADTGWPQFVLCAAPERRVELLDVYERGTAKSRDLEAARA